jgi:hypothetical protein
VTERANKTVGKRARGSGPRAPACLRRHSSHSAHSLSVARSAGAQRLLQPALKVGAANDPLEREAETTAERVVSMPAPQLAAPDAAGEGARGTGDAKRAAADDQPNTDALEADPPIPEDHLDPDVPPVEDVDTEALGAADMKEIESGEPAETRSDPPLPETPAPAGEGALPGGDETAMPARHDGAVVGAEGGPAPPDVARRVADPGSGRPLPNAVRAFMEPRFGRDFSAVRLHDSPADRRAARRIGARAFTHRQHVWIGPDESASDRELMAHELTHVVQQTAPGPAKVAARAVDSEPPLRRGYIRNKAEKYARNIPGYRLICLIIGKSPITGDTVERNAVNVLGAMMSLIPGGNLLFERLEESRVIEEAFEWVWTRLLELNITWTRIKSLVSDLIDYLPDWPSDVIDYAKKLFRPLVDDILTFIKDVVVKILEFIVRGALRLAGPWGEKVWEIIQAAGAVLMTILEDPLGFAKNLFAAVIKGFKQFGSNIWDHIKAGLLGWLFGTLRGLDLEMPERLDFKGLISIGLQIVGLTYAHFRAIMVKKLGANGERKMTYIEKSVEAVKILVKEGFLGMWQRVLQMIDNFRETVIGGIRDFVIKSLIMGGISWLAGLSNPVGAVIKVVLSIYNMIVTFLERLDQILEVARSIFASIGAIAAGRIQEAADFIERTMAATIPVVISFLAALVPVTGITNSIRNIIAKLRGAVERAIDRLVTFVVKKAKKLFSKLIAKLNSKRKLPSVNFKVGEAQHRMYAEKKGRKAQVMIASNGGHPIETVSEQTAEEAKKLKGEEAKTIGTGIANEATEADKETGPKENKIDLSSQNQNQVANVSALQEEIAEGSGEIESAAAPAAKNEEVDEKQGYDGPLFRFREPRDPAVEGQTGTHSQLSTTVEKASKETGRSAGSFYEIDHVIEKQIPKAILENLAKLAPGTTKAEKAARTGAALFRASGRKTKDELHTVAERQDKGTNKFGEIGGKYVRIPEMAPEFPAIILYRPNHRAEGSLDPKEVYKWIEAAAASNDPPVTLVAQLRKQLDDEKANILTAYQKDKSASVEIGKAINEGLDNLEKLNAGIYDLAGAAAPVGDATEKAADAKETSNVTFSPTNLDSAKPDFTKIEGQYKAHKDQPDGVGDYLEADHIFESSFGERAKFLTFSDTTRWDEMKDIEPDADKWPKTKDARQKRINRLSRVDVFPQASEVHTYNERTGKSILILRPIHRELMKVSTGAKTAADLMPGALPEVDKTAVKNFLSTEDPRELFTMRDAFARAIGKVVQDKTEKHIKAIETEYDKEPANVRAANQGIGDPKAMPTAADKAAGEMGLIVQKIKQKLQDARQETARVFPT